MAANTDYVTVKLKNGSTQIPKSVYTQLEPLYTKAYGISYTYNLPEPTWDEILAGKGNEYLVKLAYQAYEKDPNKIGDWAYEALTIISTNPNPDNKKKIIIAAVAALLVGGIVIATSNSKKKK